MSFTNTIEADIRDVFTDNTNLNGGASTFYISLHSSSPGETGSSATEESGSGYSRQAIVFSGGSTVDNDSTITFTATAGDWSSVAHYGIWDASSGGTCFYYDSFDGGPFTVGNGDSLVIDAGDLDISFSASFFVVHSSLMDAIFENSTYTAPGTYYAALHTTPVTEITGTGYSRKAVTFSDSGSGFTNTSSLSWSVSASDWDDVEYVVIYDASSGGNRLFYDRDDSFTPVSLSSGDTYTVDAGAMGVGSIT